MNKKEKVSKNFFERLAVIFFGNTLENHVFYGFDSTQ